MHGVVCTVWCVWGELCVVCMLIKVLLLSFFLRKYDNFTNPLNADLVSFFKLKGSMLSSAYRETASRGGLTVKWQGLKFSDFQNIVNGDFAMTGAAVVFVCKCRVSSCGD